MNCNYYFDNKKEKNGGELLGVSPAPRGWGEREAFIECTIAYTPSVAYMVVNGINFTITHLHCCFFCCD